MAAPKRRHDTSNPSQPSTRTRSKKTDVQTDQCAEASEPSPPNEDNVDTLTLPAMSRRATRTKDNGRLPTTEADIDISEGTVTETQPTAEQRTHGYNIRTHTRDRRPGLHVGLNWREQKEAREAAELARTEKRNAEKAKKLLKEQGAEHETQGIKKLARLEAERELEEHEEERYHEARRTRGNPQVASRANSDTQGYDLNIDASSDKSGSAYQEDEKASESSDEDVEGLDSEVEGSPAQVGRGKGAPGKGRAAAKKPLTEKQRKGKLREKLLGRIDAARPDALSASTTETDEDAFTPAYRNALLARATALGSARTTHTASPAPAPATKAAAVRFLPATPRPASLSTSTLALHIQTPRPAAASMHVAPPLSSHLYTGDPFAPSSATASPSTTGFDQVRTPTLGGSRALVIGSQRASLSVPSSPSPAVASSSSSTLDQLRRQLVNSAIQASKNDDSSQDDLQLIAGDGFGDADMQSSRDSVVGLGKGRKPQIVQLASVQPLHTAPPKKRKQRTPSGQVPPEKSKSAANLPAWIQAIFDTFVATLIDHYGASGDLWNLNPRPSQNPKGPKPTTLLTVMQEVLDAMLPEKYELKTSDRVAVVARQYVMNWRKAFLERAKTIVKHGVMGFLENNPTATVSQIAAWVKATADLKSGAAWFEIPNEPKGINALMSPYVLYIFSPHLKAVEGSLLNASNPPVNALSIACAALDTVLNRYTTGEYIVAPDDTFDTVNGGGATDEFRETSVEPMLQRHPDRWEKLLEMAREYADGSRSRPRKKAKVAAPRRRRVADSSSPVRPE